MAYFKINGHDYSLYCNALKVGNKVTFKSAVNAAGNTVVKYVTTKRTFTVGIIPLNADVMAQLLADLAKFKVSVSYRDPKTNTLVENVECVIPNDDCEYYCINQSGVMYKAMTLVFQEL